MKGEVNSNRFDFTSVFGQTLYDVYMTSPEVKVTSPLFDFGQIDRIEISMRPEKGHVNALHRSEIRKTIECLH